MAYDLEQDLMSGREYDRNLDDEADLDDLVNKDMGAGGTPKANRAQELPDIVKPKQVPTKAKPLNELPPIGELDKAGNKGQEEPEVQAEADSAQDEVETVRRDQSERHGEEKPGARNIDSRQEDPIDFVEVPNDLDDFIEGNKIEDLNPVENEEVRRQPNPTYLTEAETQANVYPIETREEQSVKGGDDVAGEEAEEDDKGKVASWEKPPQEARDTIERMKQQNAKLKKEFGVLRTKLEECIDKAKRGYKSMNERQAPTEEDITREQEMKEIDQKVSYYKRQIQAMKRQLEGSLNIDKIVALENEEKTKKKILQELESEKHSLLKIQKEQNKAMDVMINEKELSKKKNQLTEELKAKKNDYKEKQNLLRKQEKQMKEQHELYISLEERCRKLQTLINEKRAGVNHESAKVVTEDSIAKLDKEVKELERKQAEEKKRYKQLVTTQENKLKELTAQVDTLNLELKQKDKECRSNALKVNELKRQIKLGAIKPSNNPSTNNKQGPVSVDPNVARGVNQIKRDMQAEKGLSNAPAEAAQDEEQKDEVEVEVEVDHNNTEADYYKNENFEPSEGGAQEPVETKVELPAQNDEAAKEETSDVYSKPKLGLGKAKKQN